MSDEVFRERWRGTSQKSAVVTVHRKFSSMMTFENFCVRVLNFFLYSIKRARYSVKRAFYF